MNYWCRLCTCNLFDNAKLSRRHGKLYICVCACVCLGRVHGTNCYVMAHLWGKILLEQLFNSWDLWGGLCRCECCQRKNSFCHLWRVVVMLMCSSHIRPTYVLFRLLRISFTTVLHAVARGIVVSCSRGCRFQCRQIHWVEMTLGTQLCH